MCAHRNMCVIHEGQSMGMGDLCQGAVGAQKWAPQAKASRGRKEIQVRPRLRLSRSLFYPGSARSKGGPWPGGEYPRILTPYAPILCPTPTMGSTACFSGGVGLVPPYQTLSLSNRVATETLDHQVPR